MVLSDDEVKKIESDLEKVKLEFDNLDVDSQVMKDLKMYFGFEHAIEWYYGICVGRIWGHAQEAAMNLRSGRILDDGEITQVNRWIKSFGQEIKDTITKMKGA